MKVNIISDTIQEFNGIRYYLCGKYFQNQHHGRLHINVWKYHNQEPKKGYHIHHKDEDRSNNQIDNLIELTPKEHLAEHRDEEVILRLRELADKIRPLSKEWHKSKEGRKWHKEHYKNSLADSHIKDVKLYCEVCGDEYMCARQAKFRSYACSRKCTSKYRRDSGIDNVDRICNYCGLTFSVNKYLKKKFCSKNCSGLNNRKSKKQ